MMEPARRGTGSQDRPLVAAAAIGDEGAGITAGAGHDDVDPTVTRVFATTPRRDIAWRGCLSDSRVEDLGLANPSQNCSSSGGPARIGWR